MNSDETHSIANIKLDQLKIDVRLRRALMNAGFVTLDEAFAAEDRTLIPQIGLDFTDALRDLEEEYERGRQSFIRRYRDSAGNAKARPSTTSFTQATARPSKQRARIERKKPVAQPTYSRYSDTLPFCQEANDLRMIEGKARSALNVVADHVEDAFIAEALAMLSVEIPTLRKSVIRVFSIAQKDSYAHSSLAAVRSLFHEVPNSFLLFMLDSVQRNFTGNSVWEQSFAELGITDHASRQEIPRTLYRLVEEKGFRTYGADETALRYFYTMLMHAGLAESDWSSIWSRLMLPLAKEIHKGRYPDGVYPTARDLIVLACDKHSGYYLANASAINLLTKAPEICGPLLNSALSIAVSLVSSSTGSDKQLMMSSDVLPTLAMDALRSVLAANENRRNRKDGLSQIVYFPSAELRLDLKDLQNPLCLHWERTRFPRAYAGREVAYRVNGKVLHTKEIGMGVDSAILEEVTLRLRPARTYDVEVEVVDANAPVGGRLFSTQSFKANRPGTYEFVMRADGVLRQKKRPLRRNRDVYFFVAPGFKVVAGNGACLIDQHDVADGYSIATLQMSTMSCAELWSPSGRRVSAWCEGFKVTVDRSRRIGEGDAGSDLYPYIEEAADIQGGNAFNAALPTVEIEGLVENFSKRQLTVECTCDGRRFSIKHLEQRRIMGDDVGRVVILRPDRSLLPFFVNDGVLKVSYAGDDRTILNYRFSIVPLRTITLEALELLDNGTLMAGYEASLAKTCEFRNGEHVVRAYQGKSLRFDVPLSDQWYSTVVTPVGYGDLQPVTAHLMLAGIDIRAPRVLLDSADEVPDRRMLEDITSEDGFMTLTCAGRRESRGVYLSLSNRPVFYKMLPVASQYRIEPVNPLPGATESDSVNASELLLIVSYSCGLISGEDEPVSCTVGLGSCFLGYNLGSCSIESAVEGSRLEFEREVPYDLHAKFLTVRGHYERVLVEDLPIQAGTTTLTLPHKVGSAFARQRTLTIVLASEDLFGDVDFTNGQRLEFRR